jgi:hypothetical protein
MLYRTDLATHQAISPNNSLAMFRRLSLVVLFFHRLMETIHRFATNKNNEKLFSSLKILVYQRHVLEFECWRFMQLFWVGGMIYLVGRDCVLQSSNSENKIVTVVVVKVGLIPC